MKIERLKYIGFPFVIGGLYLTVVGSYLNGPDDAVGRAQGFAVFAHFLSYCLVEPMGLWVSAAFVIVCVYFVEGFFLLNSKRDRQTAPITHTGVGMAEPKPAGFGRKGNALTTSAASITASRVAEQAASKFLELKQTRGFDWYLSEHGYEGKWKLAEAGLRLHGETLKADILRRAGMKSDNFIRDILTRKGPMPTDLEEQAQLEAMRQLDVEWDAKVS